MRGGRTGEAEAGRGRWRISCEPGAIDNASGVACLIEAARVLMGLIEGEVGAGRSRTIRMLVGISVSSFFHYVEYGKRFQTPLAGLCVDAVGVEPGFAGGVCGGMRRAAGSAGFVDLIGDGRLGGFGVGAGAFPEDWPRFIRRRIRCWGIRSMGFLVRG